LLIGEIKNMSHDIKPGYKTTEFWITLLTSLTSIALSFGYLTSEQATEITKIIVPLASLIVAGILTFKYTQSRTEIKNK